MERNISKENMKECSSKSVAADKFLLIAYRKKEEIIEPIIIKYCIQDYEVRRQTKSNKLVKHITIEVTIKYFQL